VDTTIFLSELTASSPRPSRLANGAHALPLEAYAPQQSTEAPRRRFLDSPPGSPLFGANVLGERWIRWVVYISPPIRIHLARLGLGSFASMMATRRRVHPGGLGFRRPVLLSLQSISGDCGVGGGSFGDVVVRYVYSYLEKSGWSLIPTCFGGLSFLRVYSSSGDSGSPANLEASDPMSPDDVMATSHLL